MINIKTIKEFGKLNFSYMIDDNIKIETYWCRLAINEWQVFNKNEHSHSFYEMHICLKGSCDFIIDNKVVKLEKGYTIFLPKHYVHQITNVTENFVKIVWGMDLITINNDNSDFSNLLNLRDIDKYQLVKNDSNITTILELLLLNIQDKKLGWYYVCRNHLLEIFFCVVRQLIDENKLVIKDTQDKHNNRPDAITPFIIDNLSKGINVIELAEQFVLSEKQLNVICLREFGMTPGKYIRYISIDEAKKMLANLDLSINEIALKTGYSDVYAFSKAFKRVEGLSPGQFRISILK